MERASQSRPTRVEIDLGALARNFARVRDLVAPRRVWCVIKANAYGHGADECARRLQDEGADAFAVATVDEAVALREAGIDGRVLVMAGIEPVGSQISRRAARAAATHGLEVAVWRVEAARELGEAACHAGSPPAAVHLKVDSGMGRLGVAVEYAGGGDASGDDDSLEGVVQLAAALADTPGVELAGLFSNLAAADAPAGSAGWQHTVLQSERVGKLCAALDAVGLLPPERHLANSAAVLQHPGAWQPDWCNGVRPGLALCGVLSFDGDVTIALEPVMSWYSVVAAVRRVPAGWPLGYGAQRVAARDSTIAVVPVGYHDGFPRALSDRAEVLIGGRRAQVVGAISMDLTLVDITEIPAVRAGAEVVLLGAAAGGPSITAAELARNADTIAHEILCRAGARLPRHFVDTTP